MSVLIKGMDKLPEDGAVLTVKHSDDGKAYIKYVGMWGYSTELVELPEKHGRLIDADALVTSRFKNPISYNAFKNLIERQMTVIKAEEET